LPGIGLNRLLDIWIIHLAQFNAMHSPRRLHVEVTFLSWYFEKEKEFNLHNHLRLESVQIPYFIIKNGTQIPQQSF
jgi:hypothetical protein